MIGLGMLRRVAGRPSSGKDTQLTDVRIAQTALAVRRTERWERGLM
jgi:hypothetical protein